MFMFFLLVAVELLVLVKGMSLEILYKQITETNKFLFQKGRLQSRW